MNVSDLRNYLRDFQPDTPVLVSVNSKRARYEVSYGGKDGCTKATADTVSIAVGGWKEAPND